MGSGTTEVAKYPPNCGPMTGARVMTVLANSGQGKSDIGSSTYHRIHQGPDGRLVSLLVDRVGVTNTFPTVFC